MGITVEITGLNLERLLSIAADASILIRRVQRIDDRRLRLCLSATQRDLFSQLCARYGWDVRVVKTGMWQRCKKHVKQRPMILCGMALYVLLMLISSNMILSVRIDHAGKDFGEVRSYLESEGIGPFRLKALVSTSSLREALMLRLPDLAHVSVGYEGSRLVVDCQPSLEGEQALLAGEGSDIVAAQDGIVTGIVVHSGTPVVSIGQAVCKGDVLIRGEERGEQQTVHPVAAQGEVMARVWARGDARVSRYTQRTVETGAVRRRVTVCSPWHNRLVSDAQPFARQDVSAEIVPVVGLFLPLWREIETFAEIEIIREERKISDALSMAQGAAEQMAKNKCPSGVHILDKTVDYSNPGDGYIYATVVLEYERDIATRKKLDITE